MRQLKRIINSVYSIYALMYFLLLGVTAIVFYLLVSWMTDKQRLLWAYKYNWIWLNLFCLGTGIKIVREGIQHKDSNQTYVIISNHSNMLDILVTGGGIVHPFKPLFKKELFKVPVMGMVFKILGLPVDRSSPESRRKSYKLMLDTIQNGISVLIFPEGTRNRTDEPLKPFYDGAFRLAIESKVPILPIVITGIRELQPVESWRLYPGIIKMKVLEPVSTEECSLDYIEEYKMLVFERMKEKILEESVQSTV